MIQDITPHKLYNQYDRREFPQPGDLLMVFRKGEILCRAEEEKVIFPGVSEIPEEEWKNLLYLFKVDRLNYYRMPEELTEQLLQKGYAYADLRGLRGNPGFSMKDAFAAYTAKHLSDWYRDFTFCGRCGKKMVHSEKERAMICPDCGYTAYPRIMPAVIVGVKNKDRLLLTRYRTGFRHNALVAGFTEIGETLEETVQREVMEEAGIKVKNITYYKSQPWGIANDILTGFYCEVDGDDTITMDPGELSYAEWVKREDIELQPDSLSLTNEMMKRFKDGEE